MKHCKLSFLLTLAIWLALLGGTATKAKGMSSNPPVTKNTNNSLDKNEKNTKQEKPGANNPTRPSFKIVPSLKETKKSAERTNKRSNDPQYRKDDRMWPPSAAWAAVYVGIASAFATIVYAFISFCQWKALREAFSVAKNQSRPWIMVTPGNPEGWPPDGTPSNSIRFNWSAENVGQSPAFLTQLWVAAVVAPYPIPDTRPDHEEPGGFAQFIIPQNGAHNSRIYCHLTEHDIAGISTERQCLMFHGIIRYTDTFKAAHITSFCSYWFMNSGGRGFSPIGPPSYIKYK